MSLFSFRVSGDCMDCACGAAVRMTALHNRHGVGAFGPLSTVRKVEATVNDQR